MDYLKTMQTMAALGVLLKMAKHANADGKVTPQEWSSILTYGLLPIFALHGINIVPPPPGSMFAIEMQTEVDRSIAQTGRMFGV